MTPEDQLRALEQRYTRLLEARVSELERKLGSLDTSGTAHADLTPHASDTETEGETKPADDEKDATTPTAEDPPKTADAEKDDAEKDDAEKDDAETETSRYRVVVNQLDPDSGEYRDKLYKKSTDEAGQKTHAFTYRKRLRTRRERDGEQVLKASGSEFEVHFQPLQKLLERLTRRFAQSGVTKVWESPFESIVFSWDELVKEAGRTDFDGTKGGGDGESEEDVKLARRDLAELMRMISTSSGDEALDRYFRTREDMAKTRTITFETLWTLFPQGSMVLSRPFLEEEQVFIVVSFRMDTRHVYYNDERQTTFNLVGYSFDWDGTAFNRVPFEFKIAEFQDKKGVFELPVYPLAMHRSRDGGDQGKGVIEKLKTDLIGRGKLYRDYCIAERGKQTFQYQGMACHKQGSELFSSLDWDDEYSSYYSSQRNRKSQTVKTMLQGVVVVDFKSFLEYQPPTAPILGEMQKYDKSLECSCTDCKQTREDVYRYSWDGLTADRPMTNDQYLLCPPRVLGYSLKQKKWVQLKVRSLMMPDAADRTTFDRKLQLNQANKDIIWKSVQSHRMANIADYTPGKGKGLVILLWGVPGVGKTLTAESVASLVGKPLFSVGVADIGLEGSKVDTNLQRVFDLAGLWEAVLLFDEADVFLEARDTHKNDLQRNTIVSVLLRVLEYYDGILFLTTNRLRSFDIAVQSRIHVAIEYGDLTADQREAIFKEFLGQLKQGGLIERWDNVLDWVQEEGKQKTFNGRQIRNIVSTAMALAHAEKRGLLRKDLSEVALNTSVFKAALADQDAIFRNSQFKPRW